MNTYQRMTLAVRCQISAYLQVGMGVPQIARILGYHKTSIYREIRRNSVQNLYGRSYHPRHADREARRRFTACRRKLVIRGETKDRVVHLLELGWSPDEIAGRLRKELGIGLSHETVYRFIAKNRKLRVHLRWVGKRGASRQRQRQVRSEQCLSIHQRPEAANQRSRFGDWERDGMYGANNNMLLVCVDRKSRLLKMTKLETQHAKYTNDLTFKLIEQTGKKAHTITNDNGTEFRKAATSKIPIYYCDPGKPQQRGTVENTIGMLRRYITRKTDLETLSDQHIASLENLVNLRPRKILDYLTPYEVFYQRKVALVT